MESFVEWIAIRVKWGDGIIYYNTGEVAAGTLHTLAKRAARSGEIDDKDDDEPRDDEGGLLSRDCGEVFLPGERADLTLLAICGDLPFPCRVLGPVHGLADAVGVSIHLPGTSSTKPPGAYVIATRLDRAEQERLYQVLCHESCEKLEDVYRRMLAADPSAGN